MDAVVEATSDAYLPRRFDSVDHDELSSDCEYRTEMVSFECSARKNRLQRTSSERFVQPEVLPPLQASNIPSGSIRFTMLLERVCEKSDIKNGETHIHRDNISEPLVRNLVRLDDHNSLLCSNSRLSLIVEVHRSPTSLL